MKWAIRFIFFVFIICLCSKNIYAQIITTIAGNGTPGFSGDGGPATSAGLSYPSGVATDLSGNIYITDATYHIRKVIASGIISTIAGNGTIGFSGDGGPAINAEFHDPSGIAVDGSGNVYISDVSNERIRKVSALGIISTIAGNASYGYSGDGVPATAASLWDPYGVAVDGSGNIYIADKSNQRIRKINASGIISTIAGNGISGYIGDGGPATDAEFYDPIGIAVDGGGNVYIADQQNNCIRKVNASGIISTIAGDGTAGYGGDGGPATSGKLFWPQGVTIDGCGNVYISEKYNHCIRKINSSGVISTIAGNGTAGYSGDGGPSTSGKLNIPWGLAVDGSGNVYIGDYNNSRIRKVYFVFPITGISNVCVSAMVTLSDATNGGVWSSSNTTIATVGSGTGVVTGITSGTVTISYTISSCHTATTNVTVNPLPIAGTITGSSSLCSGTIITLTDVASGGVWSSSNTTATISGGILTGISAGKDTISYTVTNTCGTAKATMTITINPKPLAITGITVVCSGLTTALSDGSGGVWSSPGYTGIVSVSSTTGLVTGLSAGTAIITYAYSTGCAATTTITVNPMPTITGTAKICEGSMTLLSPGIGGGAWSSPDATVGVGTGTGIVTGVSSGTAGITYTLGTGCMATKEVTVNPLPAAITGITSTCPGATTALSDPTGGGAWSSGATAIATVSGTGLVTGISTGLTIITYALPTGCMANTMVTINPKPSVITGAANVCEGLTTALSDSIAGGAWSSSNSGIAGVDITGMVTGVGFGSVIISYVTGAGCTATKTVTVNPAPAPVTGVPIAIGMCAGGAAIYVSDASVGGVWSSTLVSITSGGLVTASKPGMAMITYTLPAGCFTTATLTINPLPSPITGSNSVCTGFTAPLTDTTAGGSWSTATGGIASVSGTGIVSGLATGPAVISYTLPTGCMAIHTITVYPMPSAVIGTLDGCVGATAILSDLVSGGVWSSPSWGIATVGVSTGLVTGISAGTAIITYTIGAACSVFETVTVLPLPAMYGITGGGSYCAGGAGVHVMLSGSEIGVRYRLYRSGALTDSLLGTGLILDYGLKTTPGSYTIIATNLATGCINKMAYSDTIFVIPVVTPSVSILTAPGETVCDGTPVTFTAIPFNGGMHPTYQWRVNGLLTTDTFNNYTYTPVYADVVTALMASNADCADPVRTYTSVAMSVVMPVAPAITITSNPGTNISIGQSVTFTATVTNGVPALTYQWLKNNTPIAGETNTTYTSNSIADNDVISCEVTSNGMCVVSALEKIQMNVNSKGVTTPGLSTGQEVISVFPNPVNDELHVTGVIEITGYRMLNVTGMCIQQGTLKKGENTLPLRYFVPGVYILEVIAEDGERSMRRVVKE